MRACGSQRRTPSEISMATKVYTASSKYRGRSAVSTKYRTFGGRCDLQRQRNSAATPPPFATSARMRDHVAIAETRKSFFASTAPPLFGVLCGAPDDRGGRMQRFAVVLSRCEGHVAEDVADESAFFADRAQHFVSGMFARNVLLFVPRDSRRVVLRPSRAGAEKRRWTYALSEKRNGLRTSKFASGVNRAKPSQNWRPTPMEAREPYAQPFFRLPAIPHRI